MELTLVPDTVRTLEHELIAIVTEDPSQLPMALSLVSVPDLLDSWSRNVYALLSTLMRERPAEVDVVSIIQAVRSELGAGGLDAMLSIQGRYGSEGNVEWLAGHILVASRRRQARNVLAVALGEIVDETVPVEAIVADVSGQLNGIMADAGDDDCSLARFNNEARAQYAQREKKPGPPGVATGLSTLDNAIGGLQRGKVIVIGARPAMGKSALALKFIEGARTDHVVGLISLEMDGVDHAARLLCSLAEVDHRRYDEALLTVYEKNRIERAFDTTSTWPCHIDQRPGLTWTQLSGRIRQWHARFGLRVAVVDYLQLIRHEDPRLPREQQVASFTQRAKNLARELGISLVLLAQLNRGLEGRDDRRPRMSDLRESGSIEQDADVVMFIYREIEYADANGDILIGRKKHRADPGLAELVIRKNRKRKTGIIRLYWNGNYTRFEDRTAP